MSRLTKEREAEIRRAEADGGRPYERSLLDEIDALRADLADENSEVKRLEQIVLRQRAELAGAKARVADLEGAMNSIALCDEQPGGCECSDMAQDFLDKAELAAVAKESK